MSKARRPAGAGRPESGHCLRLRLRLRPTSGGEPGPASHRRLTSLPLGRPGPRAGLETAAPDLHVRGLGFRSQRLPLLPQALRSGLGTPGSPSSRSSAQPRRSAFHPPPLPAPEAGGGSRGRGRVVECATRVRSPFPPPPQRSPARRRAGARDGRRGETRGRRLAGRHCRSPSGRGRAASAASRERAGGRPNGEGSRRAGKGCHVAQVDRCSPPPPPPPASGRDLWFVLGLRWGAWARPALAAPVTPARRLPPLRLPSVSRSRPGPFCRIGPAFPRLERKPDVFPPSLVVGSHGGASPFQCVGFSRKAGVVVS